ncbi:Spermatogenesis-associated protein 2-like protein [Varanus komodoensis]|uniref:spermatogenesis-associated protein 2-like protein n=1 Tax=Varanus komodoensis TaxID=61221 RepID=UPI001CF7BC5F|nr:spermatogenesis-associated protein 2-like protein [Varanus komodoensis]KAF7244655.1 Spermatogenesis-associated protein 2-like protein [Varanus komodoensis]
MSSGAALQEEYRRCLERDFRRGRADICTDGALKERLWRQLLEDPGLHSALQGEDLFAMLAVALRGQPDLGAALRSLRRAFEVLELAAIHLYFFPWRKEFSTIKTFSGVYVHVLQGVVPEADLARSFRRLGYIQRDSLCLEIAQLPPGASLLSAACGFFAARMECELLERLAGQLEPCVVSPEELLQARREAPGSLEACVAALQSLVRRPQGRDFHAELADGIDLYRESPEGPSPFQEALGAQLPPPQRPGALCERGSPRLRSRALHLRSPRGRAESRGQGCSPGPEQPYGNGPLGSEEADPETSFSFISLRRELSRTAEAEQLGARFLCPSPHYDGPQPHGTSGPASPSSRQARSPQLSPAGLRRAQGLAAGMGAATEPPRYLLHSCLRPGALPSSCCSTCRLLHGSGCDGAQLCRGRHHVEELQSEKQQRLWLQRTEVDRLLQEGTGAWQ